MKVALVDPPFQDELSVGESKSIKKVLNLVPSLGISYIAAVLENAGHEVKVFDCTTGTTFDELDAELLKFMPEAVGITGTTPSSPSMTTVAQNTRKKLPEAIILVGGAHLTALPEETLATGLYDIGVIGEGEETAVELFAHLEKRGTDGLENIKGLAYKRNGKVHFTPHRELIKDINSIPFPARHLLPPLHAYSPTPASYKKLPLGVLITSRGCPFPCTFCDRAIFGETYRFRTPENILDEIELLINKFGAKELRFFDDCMTLKKKRVFEICDEMERRKIKIPWSCLTRVSAVTKDLLVRMKEAGCWQVLYGLESGDPRRLKYLKKGATVEQNEQAVVWAKEVGLSVRADFIVGTPGETMESLNKTLDFALRLDLDYAHFNKFVPLPGTDLYKELLGKGYSFDFSKGCSILDHGALLYVPDGIDEKEYRKFLDTAYHKFYMRPSYIFKRLLSIRSFDELKGQINGFFAILGLTSPD